MMAALLNQRCGINAVESTPLNQGDQRGILSRHGDPVTMSRPKGWLLAQMSLHKAVEQ